MSIPKFVGGRPVDEEEVRSCEFKDITSAKPLDVIKNAVDEYAVAYLNSKLGGKIYWGIRNADGVVRGVRLSRQDRDRLRQVVIEQLQKIQPPLPPTTYGIELYPVAAAEDDPTPINDLFVVEVTVPAGNPRELYYTGGNEAFVKTDSGKMKLTGPQITAELRRRNELPDAPKADNRTTHAIPQIIVSERREIEATDQSLESAIYDIQFNIDSGLEPAFSTKIRNDAEETMWAALQAKSDLALEDKATRSRLLDFANFRRRREQRIFEALDILFRSPLLRLYLSRPECITVVKACCVSEAFPPGTLEGLNKLDIWQSHGPQLSSYAWLTPEEWEDYVQAARKSPLPGHPIELQQLSRDTICNKALPSILRDIARVKSKLTEKQVEECLDIFGWVVGPG